MSSYRIVVGSGGAERTPWLHARVLSRREGPCTMKPAHVLGLNLQSGTATSLVEASAQVLAGLAGFYSRRR